MLRLTDPAVERALASLGHRVNEHGFDDWGFSRDEARRLYALAPWLLKYFRTEVEGLDHLPEGRVLIVPNHSGQLPFDGIVIACACLLMASPPRLVRSMVERWFPKIPFVNQVLSRAGAVLGDPVNCRNLLQADQSILVFPEGARGSGKPWSRRYQLAPFGRGFMRLALETGTPIVPTAVIGGEESIVSIANWKGLARLLGLPYAPVSPWLPLLGPLAYLPMPVKLKIHFGEPMRFTGPHDDEDAVIDAKVAQVRDRVQRMIGAGLAARKSVF
jgi:1-acyl-sn-glycerol-3-phosphate acyltransferase